MINVLHIIHSLTVGGAARTMIATAKHSARLGPFKHKLAILDLVHTDPAAVVFAIEQGMEIAIAKTREEIYREMSEADIVQVNWWQHPEMDEFLRSDMPQARLLGWFHCAGDRPPQVLTSGLVEHFDMVLGGSSYTYLAPSIQRLPESVRLRKTGYVVGGADFDRLTNFSRRPHPGFNIGYIGTVNFVKMHPRFVALHAGLSIPGYKVIVCGGNMQPAILKQAKELGAESRFDLRGYLAEITPVLEELDVYGYPLCEDTYAASELNLQEAMFAGIPPVVFPHGGIKTLVVNEFTGLVVQSDHEYRQAIEYLYNHPLERDRLGANAREFARQMFGAEIHAPKMNSVYARLLEQPKRKREYPGKPLSALSGAELFLQSLDGTSPVFETSYCSEGVSELLEAESVIAQASDLMRDGGVGPYWGRYSNDPMLNLWYGLTLFGARKPVEASERFLAASQLGLPRHGWRCLWYMCLCAADCGDQQVLSLLIPLLLERAPEFSPARLLAAAAEKGSIKLGKRDVRQPEFERA